MKLYRLKLTATNGKHFNIIENCFFNENDKQIYWNMAKARYPGLKKTIQVFKRSNPVSIMYGDEEVVKYAEELIHEDK